MGVGKIMIYGMLFFLSIIGIAFMPIMRLVWQSEIESCRYKLYEVRSRLVALVASRQLAKDSVIFNYYYPRINKVLRFTESMHLEGLISFLREERRSAKEIEDLNVRLREVRSALQGMPDNVKTVIEKYYTVLQETLVINSNFFKVLIPTL